MSDDPADLAAERIMARIKESRRSMRQALGTFEPLEAIALLGFLFSDTLRRFPPDQHDGLLDAFVAGFRETDENDRPMRVSGGAGSNELP